MHYLTVIEMKGFFKEVFSQVFEEVELQIDEMPQNRQEVMADLKSNLTLEDGILQLGLVGTNKQEKPLVLDLLTVSLNGAKEMAKAEQDTYELRRMAKYEETVLLFKNTSQWDPTILAALDNEPEDDEPLFD
ncbi:MAG: hypothetical protein GX324_12050 [Aeromonadales bacterium]|nr:hypothetical protein [Aeromonadales bacterium]